MRYLSQVNRGVEEGRRKANKSGPILVRGEKTDVADETGGW